MTIDRPRFRDYAWGGFAIVFGVLSAVGLVFRVIDVVSGDADNARGYLSLVVAPLAVYWITAVR